MHLSSRWKSLKWLSSKWTTSTTTVVTAKAVHFGYYLRCFRESLKCEQLCAECIFVTEALSDAVRDRIDIETKTQRPRLQDSWPKTQDPRPQTQDPREKTQTQTQDPRPKSIQFQSIQFQSIQFEESGLEDGSTITAHLTKVVPTVLTFDQCTCELKADGTVVLCIDYVFVMYS